MSDIGIPITNGIVPILGLLVMHLIISVLNIKSIKAREVLCGKPRVLIHRGKIDENALMRERFTINELEERLRGKDVMNLADVEYAILETNGEISVILKPNKRGTTPEDFNIMPKYEGMAYDLVIDGVVMYDNLKILGKSYEWLKNELKQQNMLPEEALVATIDGAGTIFSQKKEN